MPLPNPGMSFTPFDPLPASDLNDLVQNIEGLQDWTAYDNDTFPFALIQAGSFPASRLDSDATGNGFLEIGRTTLGVAGDTIAVSSLPARRYLRVILSALDTGGTLQPFLTFNGDTGNNYARRYSLNGAADTTQTSQASLLIGGAAVAAPHLTVLEIYNVEADEKNVLGISSNAGTAGAGNVGNRGEISGKWANTSNQITTVTITNAGTGDFAIGSEVVVLGKN